MKAYQFTVWIALFIALLFFADTWVECKAMGGELHRTIYWYECVK